MKHKKCTFWRNVFVIVCFFVSLPSFGFTQNTCEMPVFIEYEHITDFIHQDIPEKTTCNDLDLWKGLQQSLYPSIRISLPLESDVPCKTHDIQRLTSFLHTIDRAINECASQERTDLYVKTYNIIRFLQHTRTNTSPYFDAQWSEFWNEDIYSPNSLQCALSSSSLVYRQYCESSKIVQDIQEKKESVYSYQYPSYLQSALDRVMNESRQRIQAFENVFLPVVTLFSSLQETFETRSSRFFSFIVAAIQAQQNYKESLHALLFLPASESQRLRSQIDQEYAIVFSVQKQSIDWQYRFLPSQYADTWAQFTLYDTTSFSKALRTDSRGVESFMRSFHSFETLSPLQCSVSLNF